MHDLEIAEERLNEKQLTLVVVKEGEVIFETCSHGILGFLEAMEKCKNALHGACIADKIVGKAIALLCAYVKVKAVYAVVLSKKAKEVLELNKIRHKWKSLVENILAIGKRDLCPLEKAVAQINNPEEAYRLLVMKNI